MNPIQAWNTFWFRPISARPLGVFRVVIGLLTLVYLGTLSVEMTYWLTDQGLMIGNESRELAGWLRYSPLQYVQDPTSVRIFMAVTTVVAVLFTLGWRTRIMSVLLYLGLLSIYHRNIPTNCGADALLMITVFYLMLSPCGAACSLDARRIARRRGTAAEPLIVPWAQRLIQLQLSLIYFDTSILKCNGATWLGGTALHYVLHIAEFGRLDLTFLAQYPLLINALTYSALLVEFALAFLLWFRPTRSWVILSGLILHGSILFMVNIPLFGELMTACYLVFLTPAELDVFLRVINPFVWFRRKAEEPRTPGAVIRGRVDSAESLPRPHVGVGVPETAEVSV